MTTTPMRKLITRADAERAAALLGLTLRDDTSHDAVGAAFRTVARSVHPDRGVDVADAAAALAKAKHARDLLQRWIRTQPDRTCILCKGHGHVRRGLGSAPCPRCQV